MAGCISSLLSYCAWEWCIMCVHIVGLDMILFWRFLHEQTWKTLICGIHSLHCLWLWHQGKDVLLSWRYALLSSLLERVSEEVLLAFPILKNLEPCPVSFFVLVNVGNGKRKVGWAQTGDGFENVGLNCYNFIEFIWMIHVATFRSTCWEWRSVVEHTLSMHKALGLIPSARTHTCTHTDLIVLLL